MILAMVIPSRSVIPPYTIFNINITSKVTLGYADLAMTKDP